LYRVTSDAAKIDPTTLFFYPEVKTTSTNIMRDLICTGAYQLNEDNF